MWSTQDIAAAVLTPSAVSLGAIGMAMLILTRASEALRLGSQAAYTKLYMFFWKCFYLCYLALLFTKPLP